MEDSGIYIRIGRENLLLEELSIEDFDKWTSGLDKEGLKRTLFIVSCSLRHTKESCERVIEYCNNNIESSDRLVDVLDMLRGGE